LSLQQELVGIDPGSLRLSPDRLSVWRGVDAQR
jgi:hypothetical protein